MRPLVHEPMNTASISTSRRGVPGRRSMYARAFFAAARSPGSAKADGSGTVASSGTPCEGLVPQVTNGLIPCPSSTTSVSKTAPSSERRDRQ